MPIEEETNRTRTSSYGWMMQQIVRRLNQAMEKKLSPHGLNLQQFAVMMTVLEFDGLKQSEIGAQFSMPAYAISRAVDHLESAGYLERRQHPTSRRALTIHATDTGRSLGPKLFKIIRETNENFTSPLSTSQREQLGNLLNKLM